MTDGLHLARGFYLPLDLVTEATAIVATRGAGKSSTGAVLVEEAVAAQVPTVVVDWTGVFWGLRSNAKGDGAGLSIYVLGGPHGDVPLEVGAGSLIADLVVDSGHSFVLDLSDFTKGQMRKFCADFLERLYDRKARARTTLLLVIDEAHELAPQSPRGGFKGDAARLIAAMEQVAALGRSRGIGVVMITQRTQALNKAVLDLIETLLVMRMLSPRAVAAVRDWIMVKNEDDEQGVLASLKGLPTGTAWIWAPLRGILQKVAVRRIRTFDSYATPKPGQVRVEPKVRKELDLDALGEQQRATAERAKANDPDTLRAEVRRLGRELEKARAESLNAVTAEPEVVEVSVLTDTDRAEAWRLIKATQQVAREVVDTVGSLQKEVTVLAEKVPSWAAEGWRAPDRHQHQRSERAPDTTRPSRPQTPVQAPVAPAAPVRASRVPAGEPATMLKSAERKVLVALAVYGERTGSLTITQIAMLTGYSSKGGSFKNALSALRTRGLIIGANSDPMGITQEGLEVLGSAYEPLPTGQALIDVWRSNLKMKAEKLVFDALVSAWPLAMTREQIAADTGYEVTGGSFKNALSRLRTLEVASGSDPMVLNSWLMGKGV